MNLPLRNQSLICVWVGVGVSVVLSALYFAVANTGTLYPSLYPNVIRATVALLLSVFQVVCLVFASLTHKYDPLLWLIGGLSLVSFVLHAFHGPTLMWCSLLQVFLTVAPLLHYALVAKRPI